MANYTPRSKVSSEFKRDFGNMILSQRNWLAAKQWLLSKKIGVSPNTISAWENGVTFPDSSDKIIKIIDALEFPENYIVKMYKEGGDFVRKALMSDEKMRNLLDLRGLDSTDFSDVPDVKEEPTLNVKFSIPMKVNTPVLKERKVIKIIDLEGSICNYHVDQSSGMIELVDFDDRTSLIKGCIDKDSIDALITELVELKGVF